MPGVDTPHDEIPSAAGDSQAGDPGVRPSDEEPGEQDSGQDPGDDSQPDPGDPGSGDPDQGPQFSFFITSLEAMRQLSGSQDGFGGDLGGLAGADQICQTIAEGVGAGHLTWRAFLSAVQGENGNPVNAIDRIGEGPWYDANLRLVAEDIDGLQQTRPDGNVQIVDDLPDEYGRGLKQFGDTHDVLTGSNSQGKLNSTDPAKTCQDWTSASASGQKGPQCGHSWPANSGQSWISAHAVPGCTPGVNLIQNGPGSGNCVGCGGGYGGIYCFALTP